MSDGTHNVEDLEQSYLPDQAGHYNEIEKEKTQALEWSIRGENDMSIVSLGRNMRKAVHKTSNLNSQ